TAGYDTGVKGVSGPKVWPGAGPGLAKTDRRDGVHRAAAQAGNPGRMLQGGPGGNVPGQGSQTSREVEALTPRGPGPGANGANRPEVRRCRVGEQIGADQAGAGRRSPRARPREATEITRSDRFGERPGGRDMLASCRRGRSCIRKAYTEMAYRSSELDDMP